MAGFKSTVVVMVFLVLASFQLHSTVAQTSHVVGGPMGWMVPPTASAYTNWTSGKTFRVGDTLVFNFATNAHNVLEVTQSAYGPCTLTNPITTITNGPANVTLMTTGNHYYICGVGPHCSLGQKVMVSVVRASGSGSMTPPAAASPPPMAPSSGSSLAAGVGVVLLAGLALVF